MYVCMYVCICNHPEVDRIWILVGSIPTPLKNMKVSWDDEIPNIWIFIKFMFQTTNQYLMQCGAPPARSWFVTPSTIDVIYLP